MSQKLEFTGVLLAILLLTGFVEALKCYEGNHYYPIYIYINFICIDFTLFP